MARTKQEARRQAAKNPVVYRVTKYDKKPRCRCKQPSEKHSFGKPMQVDSYAAVIKTAPKPTMQEETLPVSTQETPPTTEPPTELEQQAIRSLAAMMP